VIASPTGYSKSLASNYSEVDSLELRYKSVNVEAAKRSGVTFRFEKCPPIGFLDDLKDVRDVDRDAILSFLSKGCAGSSAHPLDSLSKGRVDSLSKGCVDSLSKGCGLSEGFAVRTQGRDTVFASPMGSGKSQSVHI